MKRILEGSLDRVAAAKTILTVVAGVEPAAPFGVVALHEQACAIALSSDDSDLLTLRFTGDARPISKMKPPIAWCDATGKKVTLWHEEKGRVVVLAAPADRLGGLLGLRELAARAGFTDSLCAQAVPLTWTVAHGQGHGGVAQGALPFWMDVYARVTSAGVLSYEVELMALARRLASQGFEPTYDSFTDISSGIDVLGLAGDPAVVAVGMLAQPPWVVTFSDRATPWDLADLAGEPRFVATTPGVHVKLASKEWSRAPAAMRHAVVFRKGRPSPLRTPSPL